MTAPPAADPPMRLPEGAKSVLDRITRLEIQSDVDISEEQFVATRAAAAAAGEHVSGRLRQTVKLGTRHFDFDGLIGVHDVRTVAKPAPPAGAEATARSGFWLHYNIELVRRPMSWPNTDAPRESDWLTLLTAVREITGVHTADVSLQLELPRDAALSFSLPIEFGKGDVPGFTSIRGVELVNTDPATPNEELYSVIIQLHRKVVHVSVSTVVNAVFDDDLLAKAWTVAFPIAKLAAPTLDAE